jgi:hypothetical protein
LRGVGNKRGRGVEGCDVGDGYPPCCADFLALRGELPGRGPEDIEEVDVPVRADLRVADLHFQDGVGRGMHGDRRIGRHRVRDDLRADAGLFQHLADGGLRRVFVRVDVAAGVEPSAGLVVVDEQDPLLVVEDDG